MFAPSVIRIDGAGIFQLIADFALAVGWVEQSGNGSGELDGMERDAELPGVRQEDGDDFAGLEAGGNQPVGDGFDGVSIFGIGQAAAAGSVDQRRLRRVAAAGVEHEIVQKKVVGLGVELGAQHAGRDCTRARGQIDE